MLKVRADPTHPDQKEIAEWLNEYDPNVIDEELLKMGLNDIANPRTVTKIPLLKPKV